MLIGARPDVDLTVLEIAALPIERSVMGSHRLQDEVMSLPEARHQVGGIAVGRCHLEGSPLDEAHLDAAARDHVQHRIFLGDAHRVETIADRHAEAQQPRLLRLAGKDRHRDRADRVDAGRRRMVLVHHDVEPQLVAQGPLVETPVVKVGSDPGIAQPVRDDVAQLGAEFLPRGRIGELAEVPDFHRDRSFTCARRRRWRGS